MNVLWSVFIGLNINDFLDHVDSLNFIFIKLFLQVFVIDLIALHFLVQFIVSFVPNELFALTRLEFDLLGRSWGNCDFFLFESLCDFWTFWWWNRCVIDFVLVKRLDLFKLLFTSGRLQLWFILDIILEILIIILL